jgi:WbqC-like protein family
MQPTFLPWLGYFSLINNVDKFVFLDSVQFESRSWQQRNRILNNRVTHWVTIPVTLPSGRETKINDVLINQEHFSPQKIRQTFVHAYSKSKWAEETINIVNPILENAPQHLSKMNEKLIINICNQLNIEKEFICASSLDVKGEKAKLLLEICKQLGATKYISPPGARVYMEEFSGFREFGIKVEYQSYQHPVYEQLSKDFVPQLSIIDAMCNIGIEATTQLIKSDLYNGI